MERAKRSLRGVEREGKRDRGRGGEGGVEREGRRGRGGEGGEEREGWRGRVER